MNNIKRKSSLKYMDFILKRELLMTTVQTDNIEQRGNNFQIQSKSFFIK